MVIVTAANSRYFTGLANMVGSIHYWAPHTNIVLYDLGLEVWQIKEVKKWRRIEIVEQFLAREFPAHIKTVSNYAWKPLVIHDAIQRYKSILYSDAGSEFRSHLDEIQTNLERNGYFFVQGQDNDMTKLTHEGMFTSLKTEKTLFTNKPHYAGSLHGYLQNSPAHLNILNPLYRCALDQACIAPKGCNLGNHRYDQSALSIIIYCSGLDIDPRTDLLSADNTQLSTNPLEPSQTPVYTCRARSTEYIRQIKDQQNRPCYPPKTT